MKGYAAVYNGEENEVIAISNDPTQLAQYAKDYLDDVADYESMSHVVDMIVPENVVDDKTVAAVAHQYHGARADVWFNLITIEEVVFV